MSRYSGIAALLVAYLACPLAWSQESSPPKDVFGPDSLAQPGVPEGKIQEFHAPDSRTFPGFVKRDGHWRLPVVLDNLIAHGDLPVIAAVFVNPGASIGHRDGKPINSNRSVEYDTLSPAYATFLWNEILPEVRQHVHLREDPGARAIGGCSSGGIASLTAAWQFPDRFRKVLSLSGSYANIR